VAAYYKVDLTHPTAQQALDFLDTRFKNKLPKNLLSVNIKADGMVAWVKLVDPIDVSSFDFVIDSALTPEEHKAKVWAEIHEPGWYPEEIE